MNNTSFSTTSCYAVLSSCTNKDPLHAFLELVNALIDEKKYTNLDPQIMSGDFEKKFGISLPYHPMQAIIRLGIDEKYFEYNSSLKVVHPIWSAIDSGEFMKTLTQKNTEYDSLLVSFGRYLQDKYNLHCSKEDLSNQVQAFIQRYGLISKTDKSIFEKVKNDYHFAEYMIYCNEIGNLSALAYIDEYITGCAFAEVMAFNVPTNVYKNCKAKVFLDTGFVFALLGIGSKDRSKNFQDLFYDMVRLGMKPAIFQHTYSEIAGIIDTARNWIGNNNYDPSLASETAYFFVTNNWSYEKATELLGDLKRILIEDFQIAIDDTPYPRVEDIHTKYEEDIKQTIIDEYIHSNTKFSVKDKDYTINQDARSVFMTLHFNNGYIAHTLPDVKNIFITTNKTLARVGKILTSEIAHNLGNYIPIALSDLTWGTLVWANSPAKISSLNKSNIISAAYAAFQPSEEVLRRLNKTLIKCQESGEISPEKCYFLKTNSVALRMLSQKTQNDENRYSDQMPFEILKELRKEGFEEGLLEKQKEVDQLAKEKEATNFELSLTKQANIIEGLKKDKLAVETLLTDWQQRKELLEQYIARLETTKCIANREIKRRFGGFKFLAVALCIIYVYVVFKIAKSTEFNWLGDAIGGSVPAILAALYFWRKYRVSPAKITEILEAKITNKVYLEYKFSPDEYEKLKNEHIDAVEQISALQGQLTQLSAELKRENVKIDSYSVDICLVDR